MIKYAYFFKGDNLIFPEDTPDSQIDAGVPLELCNEFIGTDKFEIPAISGSSAMITGVSVSASSSLPDNWKSIPVRQLLAVFSAVGSAAAGSSNLPHIIRACHIAQWREDSRFCGTCSSKNGDVPNQAQRLCPECGRVEFPRICPAIIVIITDDDNRILLARNKKFRPGLYSHISGFNEAGESLEETVERETKEEVNITVKDVEYVKSQPWPFPNSLMLGFKAKYLSGLIKPDNDEIEDARWFTKDNLPELPSEGSLSRALINCWLKGTL
jgi:NAD+ diphosphatase